MLNVFPRKSGSHGRQTKENSFFDFLGSMLQVSIVPYKCLALTEVLLHGLNIYFLFICRKQVGHTSVLITEIRMKPVCLLTCPDINVFTSYKVMVIVHLLVTSNRWHGINKNKLPCTAGSIPEPCHKRPRTPPFCRELRRMLRGVISADLTHKETNKKR